MKKAISHLICVVVLCGWNYAVARNSEIEAKKNPGLLKSCKETVEAKKSQYRKLFAEKQYLAAADTVRSCQYVWPTDELEKMHSEAEINNHLSIINNKKTKEEDRNAAMYALRSDYPEAAKPYAKKLDRLDQEEIAYNEREARRIEADEKKRTAGRPEYDVDYDVRIGMSSNHALTSNWGKLIKVNKTTTAEGKSEQWVYKNGRYLYFRNDRITAIQE